ncbi:MAG: aldo/keto reductase [Nitrospirales bacterium]
MTVTTPQRPANRLIHETSPYLLQHAHNPVDWYPWGEEALQRAKQDNKPILLSVGYSACHWCHVMERESFENDLIAELMNQYFINIKVDREERPDLDEIYMQATTAMNQGHGGWPMTVFLTPDQEPIFAGTYFPPTDKWGRPGFGSILKNIGEAWKQDKEKIIGQASRFTSRLRTALQPASPLAVGEAEIESGMQQFAKDFDARYGGFGRAPKFPPATGLSFLLRQYVWTHHQKILDMVTKTLDGMANGGMYDHIGGGFSRYSTDDQWLVPHFEKMLYDNALLTRTYVEAYQVTQNSRYQRVATETLDYILREMTSPEGGFYSATDADSEGVEGKFFVWTPQEIQDILGNSEDTRRFCAYYDITEEGNWEHLNIPHTPKSLKTVAAEVDCSPEALQHTLDRIKPLVYQARLKRIPPGLDDKIITAWNGMMIGTMAEAGRVLQHQPYLDGALRAADFLLTTLSRPDNRLWRTYRKGKAHLTACLEDYAYATDALIDVYEATGHERYLYQAIGFAERLLEDFEDQDHGGFFTTANDHEPLIIRAKEGADGATPSGNAVAALALARLGFHMDRNDFKTSAAKSVRAFGQQIQQVPRGFPKSLMVADFLLRGPMELALVGKPGTQPYDQIIQTVHKTFVPYRILAYRHDDREDTTHPLVRDKTQINGKPALFICKNFACQAPLTNPDEVASALTTRQSSPMPSASEKIQALTTDGLPGHATPQGTGKYVAKILGSGAPSGSSSNGYTFLGSTGLTTSRIGFGGYRIDIGVEDHRQALEKALKEGCNLIDTSTNYADGGSERLIGAVLKDLIRQGTITREEIIVVSKLGYVQGQNLKRAEAREQAGRPFSEMVKYGDEIWHCLHPDFLAEQLTLSLDRLGLQTLDVCLLHNPEYFLSDAKNRQLAMDPQNLEELRREFYRRLQQAFLYLESQITAGRLRYYGVSSNTCTAESANLEATSLSRMMEAAQSAAREAKVAESHFRVLQLPMNLLESGALLTPNTGKDNAQTVLEFSQAANMAVLVNRPLNAIPGKGGGIVRLADPQAETPNTNFDAQLPKVAALEQDFKRVLAPNIPKTEQRTPPSDFFNWAVELERVRESIQNLEHWDQIENQMIAPHLNQIFQTLTRHYSGKKDEESIWESWKDRYVPELLTLLKVMRMEAAQKSAKKISALRLLLDPLLPESKREAPFSRKALWALASTPGVTCVLNGIRHPFYVQDSLTILQWDLLPQSQLIFETLHKGQSA